nr:hypothetical protein [Tanacetum cinerariifolium]
MESLRESIQERAKHKREYDRRMSDKMMQSKERKDNSSKALDVGLVVMESNETESERQVHLSAKHNMLANEQQHFEQSASVYDTYLLEKVDRNTNPKSTDISHRGGEIDQNVDVKKFTPYYLPKVKESTPAKPHHVNAPSSFRNSKKELYGSNDMARNYYLEEAKKKTQDKNRNLKPREMPSAKTHHTPNACTPKPKCNNQTSRNWPASKSCEETLKAGQKADHSRNPKVNSRAKIQPNKTRNSNKPVDPTSHTQKPGRKIVIGHSFSPNKSSAVDEKTNTHRSCLRWIPTGRVFNTAVLKWVLTGKTFTSSTTNVDCEPPNGSNDYITNPYKCDQTLNVSAEEAAPKPKFNVKRTRSSSDISITPPTTAASPRLTTSAKGKQTAKASKDKSLSALSEPSGLGADEGTSSKPGVPNVPTDESEEELSWNSTNDEGDDNEEKDADGDEKDEGDNGEEGDGDDDNDEDDDSEEGDDDDADQEVVRDDDKDDNEEGGDDEHESNEETRDEESFDPIPQTPKVSKDDNDGEEDLGLNIGEEERHAEEEEEDELYRDVNINQGRGIQATLELKDSHVTLTLVKPDGQQESSSVSSQFVTSMLNLTLDVGMESIFKTTSQLDVQTPTSVAPLPMPTPTITPSTIATITTTRQVPILPTTVSSTIIQNQPNFGSLFHFDDRLRSLEANFSESMQTNQFARAVSAILGIVYQYMDQRMNEAIKVAVQIQSDHLRDEAQRDNDEFLETINRNMKKIIKEHVKEQVKVQVLKILPRIEQAVNEQLEAEVLTRSSHSSRTSNVVVADLFEMELKKILIEKIERNKSIQRSDEQRKLYKALVDAYKSDKIILDTYGETGSKRRREGKEPESVSASMETATRSTDRTTQGSRSRLASASESALAHPKWFLQQQNPPTPNRDWNKTLLAVHGSIQPWISELEKQADSCFSFNELMDTPLDFSNFLLNRLRVDTLTLELLAGPTYELMKGSCKSLIDLEYHMEEVYKATTDQLDWVNPEGHKRQQFYSFAINRESARDVYSKRRIIDVTELKIVEWHSYKHLDWITVRRDNDKLYKFKEGDFERLRIQDIKDISIVIQRRVEDLQLGVESYQKKLNLTKPDSYRSDLKRKEAYTAYSNVRGFIYQNKDKRNRLMGIDELHKFSEGTLTDVHTALDDRLKGIRMQYLPQSIWRKSDKDRAMIQALIKG